MFDYHPLSEAEARHRIAERVAKAAAPRITSRRGARMARRLRTLADRLDS
jgi:hypothetical protein